MDLLPRIGGVDPYQGGAQQRPGTGAFSRRKRHGDGRGSAGDAQDDQTPAPDFAVDPLLAEIDRLRALDPDLTESGAHRALRAARAYQRPPDALDALDGRQGPPTTPDAAAVTPPDEPTGSDDGSP